VTKCSPSKEDIAVGNVDERITVGGAVVRSLGSIECHPTITKNIILFTIVMDPINAIRLRELHPNIDEKVVVFNEIR